MNLSNPSHRLGALVSIFIVVAVGAFVYMSGNKTTDTLGSTLKKSVELPEEGTVVPAEKKSDAVSTSAVFKTSYGDIEVVFFADKAPNTVKNFLSLAKSGFYANTKFHRVIKDFMIQGGDPLSKDDALMARWGTGGPNYTFADEINDEKIVRGALAMANAGPNTNGSQFFIVTAESTPWLDGKHTVFGKVVKGLDVLNRIGTTATGDRDIPKVPVIVKEIVLK